MSEYKNEVDSMLSEDPQLAKEVEFDMRRFEREQQEQSQLPASNMNISKQNVRFVLVLCKKCKKQLLKKN